MSDTYVLDSSVVVRWYLDQVGYEHAREILADFLAGRTRLITPRFARVEVAEVLRREGFRRGVLTLEELMQGSRALDDLGVDLRPGTADELEIATRLAASYQQTVADAVFVGLALVTGYPLLTADKRLVNAVGHLVSTELLRGV